MGLLDLGLQEVLELARKSHVMLWVHFGVEGKGLWFSLVLRKRKLPQKDEETLFE